MNNNYNCLKQQIYCHNKYELVPIRNNDRYLIMKWRNEQMYHLRQNKKLSDKDQDDYFENVVSILFSKEQPEQILFSFLKDGVLIGYGGLVHINWVDKNAEISFVMNTELESDHFEEYWIIYLGLIEKIAFQQLSFHKIFTYAFDLRPNLYRALEMAGFNQIVRLKEHCLFDGKFIDVIIHSKIKITELNEIRIKLREANINDAELLFNWANDINVRKNSINTELIKWENHLNWFNEKLNSNTSKVFILCDSENALGQIRIDLIDNYWNIDYSVDSKYRGLGLGKKLVQLLINKTVFNNFNAIVKMQNEISIKIFVDLGFKLNSNTNNDFLHFELKK